MMRNALMDVLNWQTHGISPFKIGFRQNKWTRKFEIEILQFLTINY